MIFLLNADTFYYAIAAGGEYTYEKRGTIRPTNHKTPNVEIKMGHRWLKPNFFIDWSFFNLDIGPSFDPTHPVINLAEHNTIYASISQIRLGKKYNMLAFYSIVDLLTWNHVVFYNKYPNQWTDGGLGLTLGIGVSYTPLKYITLSLEGTIKTKYYGFSLRTGALMLNLEFHSSKH
jgi:hypothetical protein